MATGILVADRANGRIVSFTPEGKLRKVIFTGLRMPCKVSVRHNDVLIPNLQGGVVILDKQNKLVTAFGSNSRGFRGKNGTPVKEFRDGMFTAPHGACWDSEGNLYVEDWNATSGRVSKLKRIRG